MKLCCQITFSFLATEQFKGGSQGPCLALGYCSSGEKSWCCKLAVLTEMNAPPALLFVCTEWHHQRSSSQEASRNSHNLSVCAAKCYAKNKYLSYPTGLTKLQMKKKMNLVSGNKEISATASLSLYLCTTSPCNFWDSFQHVPLKHENGGQ